MNLYCFPKIPFMDLFCPTVFKRFVMWIGFDSSYDVQMICIKLDFLSKILIFKFYFSILSRTHITHGDRCFSDDSQGIQCCQPFKKLQKLMIIRKMVKDGLGTLLLQMNYPIPRYYWYHYVLSSCPPARYSNFAVAYLSQWGFS